MIVGPHLPNLLPRSGRGLFQYDRVDAHTHSMPHPPNGDKPTSQSRCWPTLTLVGSHPTRAVLFLLSALAFPLSSYDNAGGAAWCAARTRSEAPACAVRALNAAVLPRTARGSAGESAYSADDTPEAGVSAPRARLPTASGPPGCAVPRTTEDGG